MSACRADLVLKNCACLTDPMDYYSTICAYISKENGRLYPCDSGCCGNVCPTPPEFVKNSIEARQTAGIKLPDGFGWNLDQSDDPTPVAGAAPFVAPPARDEGYKVWQILLISFLPLLFVLVFAFFMT